MGYGLLTPKGIIGKFFQKYEETLQADWTQKIGWMNTETNQELETYRWLGQAPVMREWVGGRLVKQLAVKGYQLSNKLFEASMNINVDDIRRDKTGQVMLRVGELARRAAEHWIKLETDALTTNGTCYDGQAFFSASHAEGASGTQKNLLTSTEVTALNVATAASPTQTEMINAILGVIQKGYAFKDDQGEPMNGGARKWLIMTPTNMIGSTIGAITSDRMSGGESNPLINQWFQVDAVANPRLDADSNVNFYVFRVDSEMKPLILQSEQDVKVDYIGEGSEEEFKNHQHLFGVEALRNAGYGLWQMAMKCTLDHH